MANLEDKLDQLIAEELGISPEEVTLEFIQDYRRENEDPEERFDFSANTAGLNPPRQHVFSRHEIEARRKHAENFLHQFSRRS
jgi:hypothetical protein